MIFVHGESLYWNEHMSFCMGDADQFTSYFEVQGTRV